MRIEPLQVAALRWLPLPLLIALAVLAGFFTLAMLKLAARYLELFSKAHLLMIELANNLTPN